MGFIKRIILVGFANRMLKKFMARKATRQANGNHHGTGQQHRTTKSHARTHAGR